jgi:hypothetical protein
MQEAIPNRKIIHVDMDAFLCIGRAMDDQHCVANNCGWGSENR